MGEDASLTAFVETDDDSRSGDDGDEQGHDGLTPATTTYAFSPGGARCDECGATVERRWVQDGELVCESCKSW